MAEIGEDVLIFVLMGCDSDLIEVGLLELGVVALTDLRWLTNKNVSKWSFIDLFILALLFPFLLFLFLIQLNH